MSKKNEQPVEEKKGKTPKFFTNEKAGFYKNYDIRWLKKMGEEHPAFPLVAEYEEKFGVIEL